jgi:hypothetical protein
MKIKSTITSRYAPNFDVELSFLATYPSIRSVVIEARNKLNVTNMLRLLNE